MSPYWYEYALSLGTSTRCPMTYPDLTLYAQGCKEPGKPRHLEHRPKNSQRLRQPRRPCQDVVTTTTTTLLVRFASNVNAPSVDLSTRPSGLAYRRSGRYSEVVDCCC